MSRAQGQALRQRPEAALLQLTGTSARMITPWPCCLMTGLAAVGTEADIIDPYVHIRWMIFFISRRDTALGSCVARSLMTCLMRFIVNLTFT